MKKILVSVLAVASIAVAANAHAWDDEFDDSSSYSSSKPWKGCYKANRTPQNPHDFNNMSFMTKSGKVPEISQVSSAIVNGLQAAGWKAENLKVDDKQGSLVASTLIRNKHTAIVDIKFDTTKYSITYKDSNNIGAAVCRDGKVWLHPNYNKWVQNLQENIHKQLMDL